MARYARRPSGQRRLPGRWKHGPLPVVGLIGGIGAGKSQVAAMLASQGAAVLDADAIGHALLDQRPSREQVVARFGKHLLVPDTAAGPEADDTREHGDEGESEGESKGQGKAFRIDRAALGRLVFSDPRAKRDLEAILHPRMRKTFEKAIHRIARRREASLIVLDAAVLLEAGWDDLCDLVVFVDSPEPTRQQRLAASRGWSAEELEARQASQWPLKRKRARADHVIVNDGTLEELKRHVEALRKSLSRPQEAWPRLAERCDGSAPEARQPPVNSGTDAPRFGPRRPGRLGVFRPGGTSPRSRNRRKR